MFLTVGGVAGRGGGARISSGGGMEGEGSTLWVERRPGSGDEVVGVEMSSRRVYGRSGVGALGAMGA